MSAYSPRLTRLIDALRRLPGVGPKSAQRMAFHLLERDRQGADVLREALGEAVGGIQRCPACRMFCEDAKCGYCTDSRAASGQVCVVESPADLVAIESATPYRGLYFVLMGRLSPLDGIGRCSIEDAAPAVAGPAAAAIRRSTARRVSGASPGSS